MLMSSSSCRRTLAICCFIWNHHHIFPVKRQFFVPTALRMAQVCKPYGPFDLVNQALASLSLESKLSNFERNEVNDDSIIQAISKPETLSALPTVIGACIAIGKATAFIDAFKLAIGRREQVSGMPSSSHCMIAPHADTKQFTGRRISAPRGAAAHRRRESACRRHRERPAGSAPCPCPHPGCSSPPASRFSISRHHIHLL